MFAVWLDRNVSIQRLSVREFRPNSVAPSRPIYIPYIPEKLPPVEIPGVRFVPPAGLVSWFPPLEFSLSM